MAGQGKDKHTKITRELGLRLFSVIVLVPVIIFLIYKGGLFYKGLLIIIAFLLGYEYERLTKLPKKSRAVLSAGVFATVFWLFASTETRAYVDGALMSVILGGMFFGIGLVLKKPQLQWAAAGIPYIAIPLFSLAFIVDVTGSPVWVYWLLLVIWGCDTGAYTAGKLIGGAKLVPKISPNKTWAGFFGGIAFAAAFGAAAGYFFDLGNTLNLAMGAGLLSIWGQFGDLVESIIKRKFSAKDSGYLIPGHGGVLDSIDALLFAAPALAVWFGFAAGYFTLG